MIIIIPYFWVMFLKRFILLLTTLLLLFADSGQTLYAHTCLKSKHTHVTIGEPKHCCQESKTKNHCGIKKATCCEITSKYLKQNFIVQPVNKNTEVHSDIETYEVYKIELQHSPYHNLSAAFDSPPASALDKAARSFLQNFRI